MPRVAPDLTDVALHHPESSNAKQVLLDIIAARGGRFAGKTLLYKAFYLSHLYYWLQSKGVLTGYPIVRMPRGPGIDRGDDLIQQLQESGSLSVEHQRTGPYDETVFVLAKPYRVDPNDPRHRAVLAALDWIGERTAAEVCRIIHDHSWSWQDAEDGEELAIYIDLLSEEDLARMRVAEATVDELFQSGRGQGV